MEKTGETDGSCGKFHENKANGPHWKFGWRPIVGGRRTFIGLLLIHRVRGLHTSPGYLLDPSNKSKVESMTPEQKSALFRWRLAVAGVFLLLGLLVFLFMGML